MKKITLTAFGLIVAMVIFGGGAPAHAATAQPALTSQEATLVKTALDAVGLLLNSIQERIASPEIQANRAAWSATLDGVQGTLIGLRTTLATRVVATTPAPIYAPRPVTVTQPAPAKPGPVMNAPEPIAEIPTASEPQGTAAVGSALGGGRTAGFIILAVILIAIGAFFFVGKPREEYGSTGDVPPWATEVKEPELKELASANGEFELASDITRASEPLPDQVGSSFRPNLE